LKVRVFDSKGQALRDIPLNAAFNDLDEIGSLFLISKDSLFVLEDLGAAYVILDTLGRVVVHRSIDPERCDTNGDFYELYSNRGGPVQWGSNVYLETDWAGRCDDKVSDWLLDSELQYHERYFVEATRKCKLAQLNIRTGENSLRFGACNILEHLTDQPRATIGSAHSALANGKLFVFSPYSQYVQLIDTSTLTVTQHIPIRYMHGSVGITPPPISTEDIRDDGANLRLATNATILTFTFDEPSQHYLAMVSHEVSINSAEDERSFYRNWSLIVLDTNFQKISEHVFSGREHSGSVLLKMKRGTWSLRTQVGRQAVSGPKVFDRLQIP
jgi:hypothetical protein